MTRGANGWLRNRIYESHESPQLAIKALNLKLDKNGVTAFDHKNPVERNEAVNKTLEISFSSLSKDDQQRLCELAVFKEDLAISFQVLERFWLHTGQLDELDVEETCQRLFDHSLLLDFNLADRHIRLHDAIRAWLIGRPGEPSLVDRHAQLITSYRASDTPWSQVAGDDYLYQQLCYHLAEAGQHQELEQLLLNLHWIKARLTRSFVRSSRIAEVDLHGLVADYDLLPQSEAVNLVGKTLQMSSHVIGKYPEQVALQIYGRLATSKLSSIKRLCADALTESAGRILQPKYPALNPPGNLLLTLAGHAACVYGAVSLADGRRALSWSSDGTLRLWDLDGGALLHTLAGHEASVDDAVLLADGRRALSWSKDNDHTLRLWDLESGALLHALAGHEGWIKGAVLLHDGRRALSWSADCTLRLWDLLTGKIIDIHMMDATATTVLVGMQERRIFAGDALGHVHCISLKPPDSI